MNDIDKKILEHLDYILTINQITNVTNIKDKDTALLLHIEDSLSALPEMKKAPIGLYGDLGSGGGYPGIPLSIKTGRQTVLIDSVKKKATILEDIIIQLNLNKQISVYSGRIEELSKEKPSSFAVLTARALSRLPSLLELASPLLSKKGHLICYKASNCDSELEEASKIEKMLGMKFVSKRDFLLSDQTTFRSLIVFEKVEEPEILLPRKTGLAQKRPLKCF